MKVLTDKHSLVDKLLQVENLMEDLGISITGVSSEGLCIRDNILSIDIRIRNTYTFPRGVEEPIQLIE